MNTPSKDPNKNMKGGGVFMLKKKEGLTNSK